MTSIGDRLPPTGASASPAHSPGEAPRPGTNFRILAGGLTPLETVRAQSLDGDEGVHADHPFQRMALDGLRWAIERAMNEE